MLSFARRLCISSFLVASIAPRISAAPQAASQALPIAFEANRGQVSAPYQYVFHRDGLSALFSPEGVDFVLAGPKSHSRIRLSLLGESPGPEARGLLSGHDNYFLGNDSSRWIRNVPLYSEIVYDTVYPGISLRFYGNGKELEHDFRVEPGADPAKIGFRLDGRPNMSPDGDIEIRSANGSLILRKPVAYQLSERGRETVEAKFQVGSDGTLHFGIGSYDRGRPLIIDPVYVFSTYLGGTGTDQSAAVTADASGNILVTGSTSSADFPTSKAEQPALNGSEDAFITKLDPTGKTLIYSTYLGGSNGDIGGAIAVDANGNAIIAGLTSSSDFPVAGSGTLIACQINDQCFFLASLSADGSKLNYAGTVGGQQGNYTFGLSGDLAVDVAGNAYLAGTTDDVNFQVTAGTLATSAAGYPHDEAFVLKVDSTGKLLYSTVIPGNDTNSSDLIQPYTNDFIPSGIAANASGEVTISGTSGLGLPTTAGVVGAQFPNAYVNVENPSAGFVLQLNSTASAINFASYLPGTDYGRGMAVDATGNFYLTGGTQETNLPVSANAYQKSPVTNSDGQNEGAYVLVLNPKATAVVGATYVGAGAVGGYGFSGIALDSHNNIFVGGNASGPGLPLLDPFVTEYEFTESTSDMVLAELSADLSSLEFSTYLSSVDASFGGSFFSAIAVDKSDHLIATGITDSYDFPTTPGSFEPKLPAPANPQSTPTHSFVTVIDMTTPAPAVCLDTFVVNFGKVNANTPSTQTFHVTNCGNAPLDVSLIASSDPTVIATQSCQSVAAGAKCPITLTFTPVSSNSTSGTVTLSDNVATIPQTVSFSGQGIAPKIVAASNPLSFGHVFVGAPAVNSTLAISNQGEAQLSISNVSVSGAGFTLVSNGCTPPPATSYGPCLITLSFAPVGSGTQTGSVLIFSNDPVTPQLNVALTGVGDALYAVPSIGSISAPTVLINSGPVTQTVNGANFYPQSVAQLNGVALATTFVNNDQLQAVIPASSLTALEEQFLTVVNPLPGGGVSASMTVTPYQTLVIQPSALVSVPATGMLYAAIPKSAPANPNTVIPINPATGAQGTPIPVGNNSTLLAASSDGAYLFTANATDLTVQRIDLQTGAVDRTFPYFPTPNCDTCSFAIDLKGIPGSPQEVVLSLEDTVALYNDSGLVNYAPSSFVEYNAPQFDSIAFAGTPLTLYAQPFTSVQNPFFTTVAITKSGLQYTEFMGANYGTPNGTGNYVISDGTLLYTNSGEVWNPATQTLLGTFPVQTDNTGADITLDSALGEVYSVGQQDIGDSIGVVLSAYGMKSYALTGSVEFPQFYWPAESDLVRWGTNGLAFIGPGVGLTDQEVYLLRSSVVSPQAPNPTPTLTSISPSSANAGGPSFTLTVHGTGFLSTSVVEWNGTAVSTAYINAQQLTASIPSSSIATAGMAQVAVFNPAPGGGSSSTASFTVNAVGTTTTLSISPSAGTLAAGSSYTLSAAVSPSTGTTLPAGNVVFTIGSATQSASLNSSGAATYAGIAPVSPGSLAIYAAYQGSGVFAPSASSTIHVTVANVAPAIADVSPLYTAVGGAAFTLKVSGVGFTSGSTVYWGPTALTTQYTSSTQLTAQVPAAQIASPGVKAVTVQTPAPSGSTSNTFNFEVDSATSGSVTPPSFTSSTASETPGSTATYPVVLPSSAADVTVNCLNLPAGASCSYSAASSTVTVATSSTTPAGTYAITVVFTETLPGAATALLLFPTFLLTLFGRRKLPAARVRSLIFLGVALAVLAVVTGCGGGGSGSPTPPVTHQVTSSGSVTLTLQQ